MSTNQSYGEKELFARIAKGEGAAFTALFTQYFEPVKWNAVKMLKSEFWAEEVVQEVFMQLWASREKLADIESPAGYIFRITANRCLDRIRKQELEIRMQYLVNKGLYSQQQSHQDNTYDLSLFEKLIKEAIQQLPEQGKRVFELQRNEGLSYQEIAGQLGISKNTVRNHMVKTLQSIRSYLRENGEILLILFSVWYLF